MRRAHGFNIKMPCTGLPVSAELVSHYCISMSWSKVSSGPSWCCCCLTPSGTDCSPLPCKTNMRCSRCLEINRQPPPLAPHELLLICVVMGRKNKRDCTARVRMRGYAACREEATCMRLSIIAEDERISASHHQDRLYRGEMVAMIPWRCISDKLYS